MGRFFKFLIFGLIGLFGVVLAGIAIAVLTFDANDYKEDIAAAVKESTGREFSIDGDLSLSFFPWLAVEVGNARLGNREGFGDEPMFELTQASLSLKMAPLFAGDLEVGQIQIDGAKLNLAINKQGVNNWSDMAEAAAEANEASATTETGESGAKVTVDTGQREIEVNVSGSSSDINSFQVAGVSINDLAIRYHDDQAGTHFDLEEFRLDMGGLEKGADVPIDGGFQFATEPAALAGNITFDTVLRAFATNDEIYLDGPSIKGTLDGERQKNIPVAFSADSLKYRDGDGTLDASNLALQFAELNAAMNFAATGLNEEPSLTGDIEVKSFSLREISKTFGIELPEMANPDALSRVALSGKLQMNPEQIAVNQVAMQLDETRFTGKLGIKAGTPSQYSFTLAGDKLNADDYMAPAAKAGASDEAVNIDDTPIPREIIDGLSAKGSLTLKQAIFNGMDFTDVELGLSVGNKRLRLHPLKADLFGGNYSGDIRIDTRGKTPALSLNETINSVNLGPLAETLFDTKNLSGTIDGKFQLAGNGNTLGEIRQTLSGNIGFILADGALEGQDIWHQIRSTRALFKGEQAPETPANPRTEFSDVSATGEVANGVVTNNDFNAVLPFLRLTGAGQVNLAQATVNYKMNARVLERPDFVDVSDEELDEYTEAQIPIKITGALGDPSIQPDIEAFARAEAKRKIDEKKDEVRDRLLDRLGLGKDEEPDADAATDPDAEPEPLDPEEELKRKAREKLEDIFK